MDPFMKSGSISAPPGTPLRLCALDGGGVRGLSSIRILKNIMSRINAKRAPDNVLQPWQVFDMIGGTSTGGIIAIMLGRLRMTLEDCEDAYLQLSEKIFTPRTTNRIMQKLDFLKANGKFDGEVLEKAIQDCIKDKFPEMSADVLLKDSEASCKTFVVAVRESNSEPAILRSYKNPEKEWLLCDECTIWQACRATSAATTFFDPISIGKFGQRFVDGAILYNNPIQLVALEAGCLWPNQEIMIVNIGTGSPTSPRFAGNLVDIAESMGQILTRTQNTYDEFFESHQEMVGRGLLFRFNVIRGLGDVGLAEYKEVARIIDATDAYLDDPKMRRDLRACAEKLSSIPIEDYQITSYESQRIKNWLSPINFFVTQHDTLDRYQAGTGQWFLEAREFKDWVSGFGKTLLCPGQAGAGKTTLSSIVIEHLRRAFEQDRDVGVAWIYCDYKSTEVQTPVNLIAGLWRVLLDLNAPSQDTKTLYQNHAGRGTSPRLSEVSKLLQYEVSRYSRVFLVVDALDECLINNHTGITLVRELQALRPAVNLMITARSLKLLQRYFVNAAMLEIIASAEDIQSYVVRQISEQPRLMLRVSEDVALREEIIRAVRKTSKGVYEPVTTKRCIVSNAVTYMLIKRRRFLIAFYQMRELAWKNTVSDVRRALTTLPNELEAFYDEAIRRIERQNQDDRCLAEKILLWVSYAVRPPTLDELLHALAVEPGKSELDEMNIPKGIDVESLCSGLIVVDNNSGVVRFVHFTAQSHFDTIRDARFPEGQNSIATTCLTYLLFDAFTTDLCISDEAWKVRLQEHPLLEYAARYWGTHTHCAPEHARRQLARLALRLFDKKKNMLCAFEAMSRHLWYASKSFIEQTTGLHVATKFDLEELVRLLHANGADVNAKDGDGQTALHIAVEHRHVQVAAALLEYADINVNVQNDGLETPLLLAAKMGYQDMVELLLGRDDILLDARCQEHWTPLLYALHEGHEIVARQLLSTARFTVNSKDEYGRTPLSLAARKGLSAAVHFLLDEVDVDVDSEDKKGRTPLFWATHGPEEVTQQLLDSKAQINKTAMDGSTALHEAVRMMAEEHVVLLLRHGADFEVENKDKMTPMDLALFYGSVRMVEALLVNGVRLRTDRNGNSALHAIAYNFNDQGIRRIRMEEEKRNVNITWINNDLPPHLDSGLGRYDEMVQLLMDNGTDIDGWNQDGRTPLHTAIIEGHEILVEALLNHQANVDAEDRFGAKPLHLATSLKNAAMAQRLLKHHADIEAKDKKHGFTPLHVSEDRAMTDLLLEEGANIDARDSTGRTALHIRLETGNREMTEMLLAKGADINARDSTGTTMLKLSVQIGDQAMTEKLLEHGADIDAQIQIGATVLHLSVQIGDRAMTKLLLENGADIDAQTHHGETALHFSVKTGDRAMMKLLLENGADIDAQRDNGATALHLATFYQKPRLISVLLDKGASIQIRESHGMTACGLASMFGYESIQRVLEAPDRSSVGRRRLLRLRSGLLDL